MTDLAAFTASEQAYFKRDDQARPGEAPYRRSPRRHAHYERTCLEGDAQLVVLGDLGVDPEAGEEVGNLAE
jgi:hypothetical protein